MFKKAIRLIACIVGVQLVGVFGSLFSVGEIDPWYNELVQPFFQPPGWVFGPVWITLYTLIGIALFLLWQRTQKLSKQKQSRTLLFIFLVHLVFNAIWTPIFFGLHQIGFALIILLIIVGSLIYIMHRTWSLNRRITYLLIPYLAWVSFATILNFSLLILN